MDGGIHAATRGKGNFTQKKLGENRPQGKKFSFYPPGGGGVENLEVLGVFR